MGGFVLFVCYFSTERLKCRQQNKYDRKYSKWKENKFVIYSAVFNHFVFPTRLQWGRLGLFWGNKESKTNLIDCILLPYFTPTTLL